jgi:ribosomal protein S6
MPTPVPPSAATRTLDYEAMFLLDNTPATEDFEGTAGQVDAILRKHGAEIVHKEKWDERKLAYEIRGHRRATYYLVYFRAPSRAIREVAQDAGLNQVILRHLALALDEPIDVHIARRAEERERLAEDSRRTSLAGWGDRKKGGRDRGSRSDDDYYDEGDE